MKKYLVMYSLFMAFSLILSACTNAAPTQDPAQAATQFAVEVQAAIEATQKVQPTSTPENIPMVTPLPGVPISVACNPPPLNLGENYPDGISVYINTAFNKSWTLQNAGTCTWNANYKIKFVPGSGDIMSGPTFKLFGTSVPPGGSITLTLPLKTPAKVGTTTGIWGLYDDKDVYFGRVWVTINSVTGAPISSAFSVTSVTTTVDNTNRISCTPPHIFNFIANIQTNGAGTVTYHWMRSDLTNSQTHTLIFNEAGTQTVVYDWSEDTSGSYWVKVFIDSPNKQAFGQVNFNCS